MRKTGYYETLAGKNFFIPYPLPPQNPPLELSGQLAVLYGEAMLRLGQLNEMARYLPNSSRFIKAYVIKEALLSSAIEGIHTTLGDVFTQPFLETKSSKNTNLVLNYSKALETALHLIQQEGLPLSSRVILAAHAELLEGHANPGKYRQQMVRVGNLLPSPASHIPQLMAELEAYMHTSQGLPLLLKAGLVHVQFETIHPFLDGNGRIGRLLIVLMLIEGGLLSAPILYPSYYIKKNHLEYYQMLDKVRTEGDFEGWLAYYLKTIRDSSLDAYRRAKDIEALEKNLRTTIETDRAFSRARPTALKALSLFFQLPVISITEVSARLNKAYNTAHGVMRLFVDLGYLQENTEQKRNKLYTFTPYIELLEREYENT